MCAGSLISTATQCYGDLSEAPPSSRFSAIRSSPFVKAYLPLSAASEARGRLDPLLTCFERQALSRERRIANVHWPSDDRPTDLDSPTCSLLSNNLYVLLLIAESVCGASFCISVRSSLMASVKACLGLLRVWTRFVCGLREI